MLKVPFVCTTPILFLWGLATVAAQTVEDRPLSALVAVSLKPEPGRVMPGLGQFVRLRVFQYATGRLPADAGFPLANLIDDHVRTLPELQHNVVVSWLSPLTEDDAAQAPRFGANADYSAFFGDGWDEDWKDGVVGSPPQWNGSSTAGWMWVNHEYISNSPPTATTAPTGQMLTLARFLKRAGVLQNEVESNTWDVADVDTFLTFAKREIGGSLFRIAQDPSTLHWSLVRDPANRRFDATSSTLLRITGFKNHGNDHRDDGSALPEGVVVGILGDCSGGQSPWGTIFTAEENVQDYYGDLEHCWSSSNRFLPGQGFDPGAVIQPNFAASRSSELGRIRDPHAHHNRDNYGFLAEIDPGKPADHFYTSIKDGGDGTGHRKLGAMGRARWENVTFVVDRDFKLIEGQPIVLYGGDDRRSGRIFKLVSSGVYRPPMTAGQVRALLDEGTIHVAHFVGLKNDSGVDLERTGALPTEEDPGEGRWIELSVASTDLAPNGAAWGRPDLTVGEALQDLEHNGIGGFPTDNHVRMALFTACNKIGVMELNRPEDLEWNPLDPSGRARLYVAFTNHSRQVALDQQGRLFEHEEHAAKAPSRRDRTGSIFAIEEANPADPAASRTFRYFAVWRGTSGQGPLDASCPDNLVIDRHGGLWFGTDGNNGVNGTADALYYLDLDRRNRAGMPGIARPSYGRAFRILATPSDAEATGPSFTPDMSTLFLNVQHPGENHVKYKSRWPH